MLTASKHRSLKREMGPRLLGLCAQETAVHPELLPGDSTSINQPLLVAKQPCGSSPPDLGTLLQPGLCSANLGSLAPLLLLFIVVNRNCDFAQH